jgi:RNA polymerase sigma-70 factor (ECF subfamily)
MPADESDTFHLLSRARDGDHGAREQLFARHAGRLLGFVRARMPAALALRTAPEDVLQETLLEAVRKLDAFREQGERAAGSDRSSFYRWLVGIARFKLSEAARAEGAAKRDHEPLEHSVAASQTSPSGHAQRGERRDALAAALGALPERRAEAVRLRYLEGLSVAETALRLACSEAAVKALVARGLAELGERLLGPR